MTTANCNDCRFPVAHCYSATFPLPLCSECWALRQARGMEGDAPDPIADPIPGERGSLSWEFRPPEQTGREGCDLEITIDGRTYYQQRPPTHAGGAVYRAPVVRTKRRDISESEAALALADATTRQARAIRARVAGQTAESLARAEGVTGAAIRMRLHRAKKKSP